MRKIPTLFVRDPENRSRVLPRLTPGCEWVLAGEGLPTRKYDGTCCMLDEDGRWWARREVKPRRDAPAGWVRVDVDDLTGKGVGWEPITQSPFAKFHAEALIYGDADGATFALGPKPGTYELVGPRINGNPERLDAHRLIAHSDADPIHAPIASSGDVLRSFDSLRETLTGPLFDGIEGVVWHHPDGRMAKLKRKDFML